MIAAIKRRLFPVEPVLPGYRQPKNALWVKLRNGLFLSVLIFVGLVYGLLSAIFPYFWYIYLVAPLLIIAAAVVWALPDTGRLPARTIEGLLWAFLVAQLFWPNYIAITLPGLPWITINRLVTAPLAIVFLITLSSSRELRELLKDTLRNSLWVSRCFFGLMVVEVLTLFMSGGIGTSANRLIDVEIQWNLVFFASIFVFTKPGRARQYFRLYPWLIVFLCTIALFEWRKGGVLWADSIPSFLHADDESVQRMLAGAARSATGIYRVQSIFSTSLNFAEVLAWATPLLLYWGCYAKRIPVRVLCWVAMPPLFWMILRTDSRLGTVGFFSSFLVFGGLYGIGRWFKRRNDILGPAIVLFYPFIAALFFLATMVSNRLGAVVWGNGAQAASNEGRKVQWAMMWPKLGSWPFGHGIGQGGETLGAYNLAGVLTIDSYYLVVLLEYGVIGFFLWLGVMLGAAVQASRWGFRGNDEESHMLPLMATIMVIFVIIKGVLAQDDSHGIIHIVLGMIVGVTWRAAQKAKIARGEAPSRFYEA